MGVLLGKELPMTDRTWNNGLDIVKNTFVGLYLLCCCCFCSPPVLFLFFVVVVVVVVVVALLPFVVLVSVNNLQRSIYIK